MKPWNIAIVRMLIAFGPLAAALSAGEARAQAAGAVFAGAEYGRDWSASVGVVVAPARPIESRWAVRATASTGGYDYGSGATTVDAEYEQAEVVGLRQRSGGWGYLNVGAGVRYTDTTLSPQDPGNPRQGGRWDAVITADGVRRMGVWEAGAFAAYGVDMQEYYVRGRVTRAVGPAGFRLGMEVVAQGDPSYDRQGVAAVAMRRMGRYDLALSAGVRGGEGQVSVGLVRSF